MALNGGRQRGQSVELFRAAQLADFDAVRAGVGDNGRTAACPPKFNMVITIRSGNDNNFLAIALLLPAFVA